MGEILKPGDADEVLDIIQWATNSAVALDIRGAGTKIRLGRPMSGLPVLDLSALNAILYYEASELVLSASAATPINQIQQALAENNQVIAFEPPDFGKLMGTPSGAATLAGILSCNLAGPRRIQAGAARDHFLGFNAVSGRGETFKSGSRVVKNVTGFDLSKLMAGSYGTLAVLTEATIKVLPAPEKVRTVLICWAQDGSYDHGGVKALGDAMASPHEVSGAAHVPAALAHLSGVQFIAETGSAITAVRVEGPGPSVEHRCRELRQLLGRYGSTEELHTTNSTILWREIRDLDFFTHDMNRLIWKLSVPPSEGSRVALKILEGNPGDALYDWGGGLVWLAMEPREDALAEVVRSFVREVGGHATLFRAPDKMRATVSTFHPLDGPMHSITKRIKEGFDPNGILNPGRMHDDI
ncbi:MAG: glycolate oxidase subunit GlcE [Rhodospirillaceae bacterium TMED8]|nr:glycolate oxidase subunit GlcE [Magnetovibrio sp.]OUT48958.1 MAG: glycolate oxidase subunit GlcE [Rhodospirillaceae bacterium TMED8]